MICDLQVRLLFSSSGAVPLSRLLDALFGSHLPKLPCLIGGSVHLAGIGRIEHLAGHGLALWRINADVRARFVERIRAPGRPAEPQSTGGEQRRYCQEQMFSSHWLLPFDSGFKFTFGPALCADFRELAFDLERRRGIVAPSGSKLE